MWRQLQTLKRDHSKKQEFKELRKALGKTVAKEKRASYTSFISDLNQTRQSLNFTSFVKEPKSRNLGQPMLGQVEKSKSWTTCAVYFPRINNKISKNLLIGRVSGYEKLSPATVKNLQVKIDDTHWHRFHLRN